MAAEQETSALQAASLQTEGYDPQAFLEEQQAIEEWIRGLWNSLNRDGSDTIKSATLNCEDFHEVVTSTVMEHSIGGAHYSRAQMNMENALNVILNKADSNHDKVLSYDEFRSFMRFLKNNPLHEAAHLVFALFDLDSSLSIDRTEFREMLRFFLGHNPTQPELEREWALMATEGQTVVSRAQYISWLQNSRKPIFHQYAPPVKTDPASSPSGLNTSRSRGLSTPSRGSKSSNGPRLGSTGGSRGRTPTPQSTLNQRIPWNKRFNAPRVNPGHINDELPDYQREYFSEPQTEASLGRFYNSHYGFQSQSVKLITPEPKPAAPPLMPRSLSTGIQTLMTRPSRHAPGGTMRSHHGKRELTLWQDHFLIPESLRRYGPPSEAPLPPLATFGPAEHRKKVKGYLNSNKWSDHFFVRRSSPQPPGAVRL